MIKFFTNFRRSLGKFLHKHWRYIKLLDDIEKNQVKFDQADLVGNKTGRIAAEERDTILRALKRKMMKKPRGI